MNIILLKKIFHKNVKAVLILFLFISSLTFANNVDEKIEKIINASPQEKELLIKELKEDISTSKYNKTDTKKAAKSNKTIDEKIENRKSKSIPMSRYGAGKCGMGKCGSSHGSKCGSSNDSKCGGGSSHGSKCGSGKCGMGN